MAPAPAPTIDATIRPTKARSNGGNCERSASAASMVAGMMDARLRDRRKLRRHAGRDQRRINHDRGAADDRRDDPGNDAGAGEKERW